MSEFGSLLKNCRERQKMTKSKLARSAGVDPSLISRIESGDRKPSSREFVLKIARVLNLGNIEKDQLLLAADFAPTFKDKLKEGLVENYYGWNLASPVHNSENRREWLAKLTRIADIIGKEETDANDLEWIDIILDSIINRHE